MTQREVVSEKRQETQNIQKKVIQPIIKDVIQPIHLKVKPVIQEAIKPIIVEGQQYRQAINQGVQKLPISYLGTNFEKEVLGETLINKSIYKTSTLPAQYRPVQYKPEMITEVGLGLGAAAYQTRTLQRSSIGGITEINGGTTIRPSIVRKSVLPTINQGTTVLNTVFGGTRTTVAPPGSVYAGMNQGALTTTTTGALTTTTTGQTVYGTTVLKPTLTISNMGPTTTSQYGGVVGVGNSVVGNTLVGSSVVRTGYMPGSQIMGIGGGVGDLAADVTYSTKPDTNMAIPTGYM